MSRINGVQPKVISVAYVKYGLWIGCLGLLMACSNVTDSSATPTTPETPKVAAVSVPEVPQKVSLTVYFWYGCPHCFEFRHYVQPWLAEWGDKLDVTLVPIALKPSWVDHARAFYAAQALGVLTEFHPALYDALHVQKRKLNSVATLSEFADSLGLDAAAFEAAMVSPATTALIRRDNAAVKQFGIQTTPTLVVAGQQRLSLLSDDGYDGLLHRAEDLIEQSLSH